MQTESVSGYMPVSKSDEWATPEDLFAQLHQLHDFTLDAAASNANKKLDNWCGLDHPDESRRDGLNFDWSGQVVWLNPPYGRQIKQWVKKAHAESSRAKIVMLLPARTDTAWFHDFVVLHKVTFLRGRLKFGGHKDSAPFPSILVEMNQSNRGHNAD